MDGIRFGELFKSMSRVWRIKGFVRSGFCFLISFTFKSGEFDFGERYLGELEFTLRGTISRFWFFGFWETWFSIRGFWCLRCFGGFWYPVTLGFQ